MDDLLAKLGAAVGGGFVIALLLTILWVVFWTVTVPGVFPGHQWDGHDAWTRPVFIFSWLGVTGMGLRNLLRF